MKHLLPQVPYYKANLHTHSTVSDGKLTPEEVKAAYKAEGYSILALTDHSATVCHQDLSEEDLLMLTGVEMSIDAPEPSIKTTHLCMLSKDPSLQWIPFRDPEVLEHMQAYLDQCQCENMDNSYTPEAINAIIAKANEKGFLVTYNHPTWSLESYPDYAPLKGLWAMEYRNSESLSSGFDENNSRVYQDLLCLGNRLMPVMADDMHIAVKKNGARVLGANWTMVGAQKLEYSAVMEALERGDLYSSCGPTIESLTWDQGKLRVTCSPAARIQVVTQRRAARLAQGEALTEAEFDLSPWQRKSEGDPNAFFRLIVTAADGTYAVTRAYFLDEL